MKGKKVADTTIPTIERILVPVDRTTLSMKAANYGIHLAEVERAKELIIMHVVARKHGGAKGLMKVGSAEDMIKPIEEEAKKKEIDVKSEVVSAEGTSVANSITEYAYKNHIDLIVIGGGDVSQRKYLIVGGGVAIDVIKRSQCPVIVMR
jgi:nucleotide-binding universal stress UspA family protein